MTSRKKFIKQSSLLVTGGIFGLNRAQAGIVSQNMGRGKFLETLFQSTENSSKSGLHNHNSSFYYFSDEGWQFSNRATIKPTITILHTNDFHSRFEAFEPQNKRWGNQGGIARMKELIDQERSMDSDLLLFDSGDVFQGTPYFNVFKGHPELEWMNKVGYDATTIGNHDFDLGIEHLHQIRMQYNTPTLNCNYQLDIKWSEKNLIKPYKIIERKGIKIGVTGVGIDLKGLLSEPSYEGLYYNDPVEILQKTVDFLKNDEKCALVIVLSHLGYKYNNDKIDDLKLAAKTHGIDAILGGHTHTFLDEPTMVKNLNGKKVIVNQAGWAGLRLGKIVFALK